MTAATDRTRNAFLRACELDVQVRKPGNVSLVSPGHGMDAALFLASAKAAAGPICATGTRVGQRIEQAVLASWAAAGCNTNLGILLLCAPVALAAERHPQATTPAELRAAIAEVLAELNLADAQAAFRAIARANPGGLGSAAQQDVHQAPSVDLRAAMALAAERDSIALQYRDGYAQVFGIGLPALGSAFNAGVPGAPDEPPGRAIITAVQRAYLALLSSLLDSHIVRRQGHDTAEAVRSQAQQWHTLAQSGADLDADPAFAAWDQSLKDQHINPGTSADLTVASIMVASLASRSETAQKTVPGLFQKGMPIRG